MSIVPITFNDKNVPSAVDGGFYNAHNGEGILLGCDMTITATSLIIQSGLIMACGRIVRIDGATTIDLSEVMPSSGYLQVVLNVSPLSDPPTELSFNTSGGAVFPDLTKEDINTNPSGLYQLELAVVQVSGGNLTSINRKILPSNIVGNKNITLVGEETQLLLYKSDGTPSAVFGTFESDNYSRIGQRDSDGNVVSGTRYANTGSNDVIVFGHGGNIVFRPNGVGNSAGQMYLDGNGTLRVNGDVRRTPQTYSGQRTASMSVPAENTKICETTVVSDGVYLISASIRVQMSGGGHAYINLYKSSSAASGTIVYDLHYLKSGSSYISTSTWATFIANTPCSFYLEPSANCTIEQATLDLLRIA